ATVQLLSVDGREMQAVDLTIERSECTFDIRDFQSGVYFIRVTQGAESTISRIVISK
ncbi:MAG: T9SS type A sorting domain-containing protein, partial [Bacteroidia bacterium]|nr:T9SS type A sorting domain-containing protein [Bacteroidia bacterium]